MYYVYRITHPLTKKYYIGYTFNLRRRALSHLTKLKRGVHPNKGLLEVFRESVYLTWEYLTVPTLEEATSLEKKLIIEAKDDPLLLNVVYAQGFSEEHKRALAATWTDERKKAWCARQKQLREEGISYANVAEVQRASWTDERREKYRKLRLGLKHTTETKEKISAASKGRVVSEAQKQATSRSMKQQVTVQGVVYAGILDAAKAIGLTWNTLNKRLKSNDPKWVDWKYGVHDVSTACPTHPL